MDIIQKFRFDTFYTFTLSHFHFAKLAQIESEYKENFFP